MPLILIPDSVGLKSLADAVAGINAPRRTAEYNGERLVQLHRTRSSAHPLLILSPASLGGQ